ncbi:MAG TPA: helix-turn-helix transcriptional regulator [Baekduia sp.]|nr:helix-turn-helix transcriptional regulator [Baekduia sp.]
MSLRHAVLGLLAVEPTTGYELARKFDVSLGNAWHASHSQIYPELGKLEDEGMIEVIARGARNSRTWAVTDTGRRELRRWLVEVEPSRQQRNESAVRTFLAPRLLEPADARIALQRDLDHVLAQREELHAIERRIAEGGGSPFAPAVDLGLRFSAVMEEWLRDQLAELAEPD